VTVLRDGKTIGETKPVSNVTEDELVTTMVGREITDQYPKQVNITDEPFLTVQGFGDGKYFEDVNFTLHRGEVLGIAGLVGAGRSEMAEAIFGLRKYAKGKLTLRSKPYVPKDPRYAIENKIGFITKSRRDGLLLHMPIYRNVTVSELREFSKGGFRIAKKEMEAAERYVGLLSIDASSVVANVDTLSGGNQQKVAVAKWYCNHSEIFIMDDPTRGVDVGSKTEIYDLINEITKTGAAVILISSDMPELLGISDNVLVMKRGRIAAQFKASEATQEMVVERAAGGD
jgi:ABC-type sugar transport system ATPase subunit